MSEPSLRARVAHYLRAGRAAPAVRVQLRYRAEAAEFTVSRDGDVRARRRFEQLPAACADRRDTLALAIALAIEHAAAEQPAAAQAAPAESPDLASSAAATASAATADSGTIGSQLDAAPRSERAEPTSQARAEEAAPAPDRAAPARDAPELPQTARAGPDRSAAPAGEARPMPWRARLTQTALHAGARVMLEVLPAPVAAFSAGVELPLAARFDLQLSALASMRAETELAPATVRTQLLGAELVGCAHAASLPYLYGCLGLSGGAVRAAGDGYAQDRATTLAWLAGLARAAFRLSLTALTALQLTAGAHVNVFRPELLLLGSERTELSAVAGGSFGLDVIVAFE